MGFDDSSDVERALAFGLLLPLAVLFGARIAKVEKVNYENEKGRP